MELLGHRVWAFFISRGCPPKKLYQFSFPPALLWKSLFPIASQDWYHQTLDLCQSKIFHCVICISLIAKLNIFLCIYWSFGIPLLWTFYSCILTIFLLTSLVLSYFKNSLYIGDIKACPNILFQSSSHFVFSPYFLSCFFFLFLSLSHSLSIEV